jgi:dual specificity protein kinase YAK1
MTDDEVEHEMQNRLAFVDFVRGLLNLNPFERWTPHQAAGHPFITEAPFKGPYVPTALTVAPRVSDQKRNISSYSSSNSGGGAAVATAPKIRPNGVGLGPPPAAAIAAQGPSAMGAAPPPAIAVGGPQSTYYNGRTLQIPAENSTFANAHHLAPPAPALGGRGGQIMRRARATTIGQLDAIPAPIQRATALVDPAQPIRAQPSPAYIPPPDVYQSNLYGSHATASGKQNHLYTSTSRAGTDVIRNLEDGLYLSH